MEGRLCRLNYSNYDKDNTACQPRQATFLLDLFPEGSVLFASTGKTSLDYIYVYWSIVVLSPYPLDEGRWIESWQSIDQRIHLGRLGSGLSNRVELVEAGQELKALDQWKMAYPIDNCHEIRTGSLESIQNAIRAAEKKKCAKKVPTKFLQNCAVFIREMAFRYLRD
jgi:hypothetical protein